MSIVYFASKKGKRKSNEDNESIHTYMNKKGDKPNINLYGIYDGHGGRFVSEYLSKNLPGMLIHKNVKYPLSEKYIIDAFQILEDQLYKNHKKEASECGSTCLVVCHYKNDGKEYLDVMNTGDSRLVACNNNFIASQLTIDHKPNSPLERRRLMNLGAKMNKDIWNDRGDWRITDLSVSKAFGDKTSDKYVSSKPDIFRYKVTDNLKFMILGCDGLWDVMSNQEAIDFVIDICYDENMNKIKNPKETNNKDLINVAEKLASYAIDVKESSDNVTIVIVFFD